MTEAEWIASTDPAAMLDWMRSGRLSPNVKTSDRRLRLFACACCRAVWDKLTDDSPCPCLLGCRKEDCHCGGSGRVNRSRRAVEVAERFADGLATLSEMQLACDQAQDAPHSYHPGGQHDEATAASWAAFMENEGVGGVMVGVEGVLRYVRQPATQAALLRDIFGNPFRPVTLPRELTQAQAVGNVILKPSPKHKGECPWLTSTVVSLAQAMYETRDFGTMPILGDALEDSGCTDQAILNHCLEPLHVRGCWVLDLCLGKE